MHDLCISLGNLIWIEMLLADLPTVDYLDLADLLNVNYLYVV